MATKQTNRPAPPDEAYYRGGQVRRWGALLLVVGLVWLVFELTSRGSLFGVGLGFMERSADAPAQSYTAGRLVVRGAGDNIFLERAAGDQISVAVVRHGFGWNASAARDALERLDVKVTQSGDTLNVEVQRGGLFGGFVGRTPYVDLHIDVPAGTALDVQTGSGDLKADGLRADGSLATVSGDISVTDSAGELQVNSTSGTVQLSGSFSSPRVETVSGDVTLSGADGSFYVRTISGDIDLRDLRDARLDIETTSGDVDVSGAALAAAASRISTISGGVQLRLANAADLRLDVSTLSGDLSSDLALRDMQSERHALSGVLGSGKATLTIHTTSGDVAVNGQ